MSGDVEGGQHAVPGRPTKRYQYGQRREQVPLLRLLQVEQQLVEPGAERRCQLQWPDERHRGRQDTQDDAE